MLNEEEKKNIKKIIDENTDSIEDAVNFHIRAILNQNNIKENENLDAISYARNVFYNSEGANNE